MQKIVSAASRRILCCLILAANMLQQAQESFGERLDAYLAAHDPCIPAAISKPLRPFQILPAHSLYTETKMLPPKIRMENCFSKMQPSFHNCAERSRSSSSNHKRIAAKLRSKCFCEHETSCHYFNQKHICVDNVLGKGFLVVLASIVIKGEGQKTFWFHDKWRLGVILLIQQQKRKSVSQCFWRK